MVDGGRRPAELVIGARFPPNVIDPAILEVYVVVAVPAAVSEVSVVGVSETLETVTVASSEAGEFVVPMVVAAAVAAEDVEVAAGVDAAADGPGVELVGDASVVILAEVVRGMLKQQHAFPPQYPALYGHQND